MGQSSSISNVGKILNWRKDVLSVLNMLPCHLFSKNVKINMKKMADVLGD
jgi:hypothetical protein